jgi:hypothetical protein
MEDKEKKEEKSIPAQGKPVGENSLTHSENVPTGGDGITQPKSAALPSMK